MKSYSQRSVLYTLLFGVILFISSCISNAESDFPSQIQLGLEVQNVDTTYIASGDTINIEEVRLIRGSSYISAANDSLLLSTQIVELVFDQDLTQPANPRLVGAEQLSTDIYQALDFIIPRAPQGGSQVSSEFTDGGRFSIIVDGTFNSSSFTFKSSEAFKRTFSLNPPIEASAQNEQYIYVVRTDMFDWFVDGGTSNLLDPGESENASKINTNIDASFSFERLQPEL